MERDRDNLHQQSGLPLQGSDEAVFRAAAHSIEEDAQDTCSLCGRGAAGVATPDMDDLEALISIRDGFNKHRRDFSPAVAEKIRRFDHTISYLHRLIAGTRNV